MPTAAAAVPLAFVPGILSLSSGWQAVVPEGARLVPVDYRPATSATSTAGGTVLYQCLDLLAQLHEKGGEASLVKAAREALGEGEDLDALEGAVRELGGRSPRLPVAVLSFEGSLMPCDVLGWAEFWAEQAAPPTDEGTWIEEALHDPESRWTWDMVRGCASALVARCASEPPRHLASIGRWLRLQGSPGFVYVAGRGSATRNRIVFPALRDVANKSSAEGRLRIFELPHAGHNLNDDDPRGVRDVIAAEMGLAPDLSRLHRFEVVGIYEASDGLAWLKLISVSVLATVLTSALLFRGLRGWQTRK